MQPADFKEITERLRNLERVLDNLNDGIIVHDLDRKILFFNRAAEDVTGYKRERVLGRDCHDVFGRPFCGSFCVLREYQADEAINSMTQRVAFTTHNGHALNLELNVSVIADDDGRAAAVLVAFQNYTEILKLKLKATESSISQFGNIIGQDPKMIDVFRQIQDIAAYDFPVYIFGETGTGKELVARAIHDSSRRKHHNFVPINCGALPEGLLESELFGHVRGSFSGAVKDKKGRLELAHKGTVFLDEIGELPLNAQTRLLRFLQEGVLERVGSTESVKVDAHVICATNKDLKEEVFKGNFREDLFYRLNVIPVTLPPLRERKSDVLLLINHFLTRTAEYYKAPNTLRFNSAATVAMMDYEWPGNVRELQNAVQFAFVHSRGANVITVDDLPMELHNLEQVALKKAAADETQVKKIPAPDLSSAGIAKAIEKAKGNKTEAAKILGVSRATFYRHLPKSSKS